MIKSLNESSGKIFTSPLPSPGDVESMIKQYKIKFILSLDSSAYQQTRNYLNLAIKKLSSEKIKFIPPQIKLIHIDPSNPTDGAKQVASFLRTIKEGSKYYPMLIHCQAGKDRTGFACAKWLIENRSYKPEDAVKLMETKYGYGTGGISPNAKKILDEILGVQKIPEKAEEEVEDLEDLDILSANDDIVEISRGNTPNRKSQYLSSTTSPQSDPQQSFSIFLDPDSGYPNNSYEKNASRKLTNKQRKNILKRLLNKPNTDNNNLNVPSVGEKDNYDGLSSSQLNAPSGSPGAPNGASFSEPSGTLQM